MQAGDLKPGEAVVTLDGGSGNGTNARGMWDEPEDREKEAMFASSYCGEYTEVLRKDTVPIDVAREAMRIYFRTGKRPDMLIWD